MKGTELLKQALAVPKEIPKDKQKAIEQIKTKLDKQFNTTASIVKLGDKVNQQLPSYPTGYPTFDLDVLGCGGIPKGRIIEILGPESSGKTTVASLIVAAVQKQGQLCAYIDSEHALDPNYMAKLGVDVDNLLVSQPDSGEQALETAEALVDSQAIGLIVVDSVAALVPQAELDGEMGDANIGLQARLMSQAMRKLRGKCDVLGVPIIFINQIREKIGVMFGSPETTTGGRALRFYASIRLDVRKASDASGGFIKQNNEIIGHKLRIKAIKNKCGIPFHESIFDLYYGKGIDKEADIIQYAINSGIVEQAGAWFKFDGQNYQGKNGLLEVKDEIICRIQNQKNEQKSIQP